MTDPASRFRLFQLLADLPQPQFEGLLFALNIPSGNIPASSAPQAERVRAVLVWAESPIGCGLRPVAALAREMFGLDAPAFLDDEPAPTPVTPEKTTPPPKPAATEIPKPPPAKQPATPKQSETNPPGPFTEDLGNSTTLEMVHIPAGTFWMGSPENEKDRIKNKGPQHKVQVPEFWMGKYPVTQQQWYAVSLLGKVNREMEPHPSKYTIKPHPSGLKGNRLPVESVSWYDAIEFCDRLSQMSWKNYRLPSEAEWEYACRAHTTTRYHFGDHITGRQVNCDFKGSGWFGIYRERMTPVGEFAANKFGLYDMHGNVSEWCQDVWHENYEGAPTDGSAWIEGGDSSRRVHRGGQWYGGPSFCRSARRNNSAPSGGFILGFRVVCTASQKQATNPRTL